MRWFFLFIRRLISLLMLPGISDYSFDRFLRYWSQRPRGYLMIFFIWHFICMMMPHIALGPLFAVFKWISLSVVKIFPFHLLRRTPLHNSSILGIIVIQWWLGWVPIIPMLFSVIIIVVVIRWHHRRWVSWVVVPRMMRVWIRWWRRWIPVVVVRWRLRILLLSSLIMIHVRVLVGMIWWRKLVTLEWLILMVVVRAIKLHTSVVSCRISSWCRGPESSRPIIAIIELRVFLTLTSIYCRRGGRWGTCISLIAAAPLCILIDIVLVL